MADSSSQPRPIPYADAVATTSDSAKLVTPAAERNKEAILEQLKRLLPHKAKVLEIASGSGQHCAFFSAALSEAGLLSLWQPTDIADAALASIEAYRADLPAPLRGDASIGVARPARLLDVSSVSAGTVAASASEEWLEPPYDAMLAVNLLHIAPFPSTTMGLLDLAAKMLKEEGLLLIYGAFLVDGKPTTESNAEFDRKLKAMNPSFGLRDLKTDLEMPALERGLGLRMREVVAMPSNNFLVVVEKTKTMTTN